MRINTTTVVTAVVTDTTLSLEMFLKSYVNLLCDLGEWRYLSPNQNYLYPNEYVDVFKDVFGNPSLSVTWSPTWSKPTRPIGIT